MLNFRPNFKFSRSQVFWGTPSPFGLFHGKREESLSITFLSDFGYLEFFQRYSRSKSKVVNNRVQFWTFFSPSQISGAGLPEVIHML